MKCNNCNSEIINGAEFCGNCGTKIVQPQNNVTPPNPVPTAVDILSLVSSDILENTLFLFMIIFSF